MYEKQVWENVRGDAAISKMMEDRVLYGQGEHPEGSASNLLDTSHIITSMFYDIVEDSGEKINKLFQTFEVLDTPAGRIIDSLIGAGCKVGCSTRAQGDLEEMTNEDTGDKYFRVIPENYEYITTDFTATPSTFGVAPVELERKVVNQLKQGLSATTAKEQVSRQFAMNLLESMHTDEAKHLRNEIEEQKEQEVVKLRKLVEKAGERKVKVKVSEGSYPSAKRASITVTLKEQVEGEIISMKEDLLTVGLDDGSMVTVGDPSSLVYTAAPEPMVVDEEPPMEDLEPMEEIPAEMEEIPAEEPLEEIEPEEIEEPEEDEEEVEESKHKSRHPRLKERKLLEYFSVGKNELLDIWKANTNKESIKKWWEDASDKDIDAFIEGKKTEIEEGEGYVRQIDAYADRHGIIKDMDMPEGLPMYWVEEATPWAEAYGIDVGRGGPVKAALPDYGYFEDLVDELEEYVHTLEIQDKEVEESRITEGGGGKYVEILNDMVSTLKKDPDQDPETLIGKFSSSWEIPRDTTIEMYNQANSEDYLDTGDVFLESKFSEGSELTDYEGVRWTVESTTTRYRDVKESDISGVAEKCAMLAEDATFVAVINEEYGKAVLVYDSDKLMKQDFKGKKVVEKKRKKVVEKKVVKKSKVKKLVFESFFDMADFISNELSGKSPNQELSKVLGNLLQDVELAKTVGFKPLYESKKTLSESNKKAINLTEQVASTKAENIILQESLEKVMKEFKEYKTTAEDLLDEASNQDKKDVLALTNKLERSVDKNKRAFEALKKKNNLYRTLQEETRKLEEKVEKTVKESQTKEVRDYVGYLIQMSGVHLSEKARTLIEECETKKEVDEIWDDLLDVVKTHALHEKKLETIKINPESEDVNSLIDETVGELMESISKR